MNFWTSAGSVEPDKLHPGDITQAVLGVCYGLVEITEFSADFSPREYRAKFLYYDRLVLIRFYLHFMMSWELGVVYLKIPGIFLIKPFPCDNLGSGRWSYLNIFCSHIVTITVLECVLVQSVIFFNIPPYKLLLALSSVTNFNVELNLNKLCYS